MTLRPCASIGLARRTGILFLVLLGLQAGCTSVPAAGPVLAAVARAATAPTASGLLAENELVTFIKSFFTDPERMVVLAAVAGVLALFIITRGKWR